MKEFILFLHPMLAVFGIIFSVWTFVEVLNISEKNSKRITFVSVLVAISMLLTWITSGFWYISYYATDKAIILKGPWAFAHSLIMESKEHIFFSVLILSLYVPIISMRNNIVTNKSAQSLMLVVTTLIILLSLALEGAGAIISFGVRMGLIAQALVTP